MSLNPLIAKEKPNGNIQCLVCNTEVKQRVWTAHVNSKKHRESIEKLKTAQKRGKSNAKNADEPPSKKQKEEEFKQGPTSLPTDFFDEEDSTPFRKDESKSALGNSSHLIEGVPAGFFDDKRLDGNVRETRERNAELDKEFERWKEEIGEEQVDQDAKQEQLEAAVQRELELGRIDEQMAALKKLNDLEIQKEKRLNQAKERRLKREQEQAGEEEDDDDGDIDLDGLDWRAKNIFS